MVNKVSEDEHRDALNAVIEKGKPAGADLTSESEAFAQASGKGDEATTPAPEAGAESRLCGKLARGMHLPVRVELGRRRMLLKETLKLEPGDVVDLDRLVDDPVEVFVNDMLIARGQILVVNDCFCIRITEVHPREPVEQKP